MASTSQPTAPPQHEKLWELLAKDKFPQEVTGFVQKHLSDDEDWARERQVQWQHLFDLKMEVLAKKLHEIEHTVAMLESPQLSADMRALILKPNVTPRTFAEKAFKTVMTDLFLRSFHVSERGARSLWSAFNKGNQYYEEDESRILRDRWVAGELPSIKTIVERFWIMRHFDPLTDYHHNRELYLQDVSRALWYAKKIYSYYDPDYLTSDVKMLQLSIHNLERLIHKAYHYNPLDWRETQMVAMERYHNIMERCRTHVDVGNARFRYKDRNGKVHEVEISSWIDCKKRQEITSDERADDRVDEGNDEESDEGSDSD